LPPANPASPSRIPTPQAVLGYGIAERAMHYHEVLACLTAMAAASDRASLSHYGETPTGRKLLKLTISSPANLSRLSQIEDGLRRLGDEGLDEGAARKLAATLPAVAWMGYGIHGDEISGTDCAVELAYRLLSGEDAETLRMLDALVIHIDPMVNPDGRERCLAHHTAYARTQPAEDPQDLFHLQVWPEGRGNHYLFDLNRDAIFTVQEHSRQRATAIAAARPQLYVDAHEMAIADTYLFAVPAEPLNPHLPRTVHDSWREVGGDHGEAFDREGINYYTRSWNEVFYPGFFDIWPSYHGAVPILYEMSATAGGAVRLPNGKRRDYREAVRNQLVSSLANLSSAVARKAELLHRYWQARAAAVQHAGTAQAWVIPPADGYKQRKLVQILETQGIRYERLEKAVEIDGLHGQWDGESRRVSLPAGTLLVRTAQPLGALVRNIFDFHVPLGTEFLRRERQGVDLGSKTLLFDASAWSLPLAFGLDAYWSAQAPEGEWRAVAAGTAERSTSKAPAKGRYGYVYGDPSLRATAQLLRRGVKVRVAREAFAIGSARYDAGTFLIRHDDQQGFDAQCLREPAMQESGVEFVAVDAARVSDGPDLGGSEFVLLAAPAVAVLTGTGSNAPNSGALWHLFDVELGIPVTLLEFVKLGTFDLSPYNVIVLADTADRAALVAALRQGKLEQLRQWVENGGTLIGLSGSALALAETGLTAARPRAEVLDRYPPLTLGRPVAGAQSEDFSSATGATTLAAGRGAAGGAQKYPVIGPGARAFLPDGQETFSFPQQLPSYDDWLEGAGTGARASLGGLLRKYLPRGAYVRAELRPQHWLRYGVPDRLPALFREGDSLICEGGSAEIVGRYAAPRDLALAGLIWPEAVGYISGTAYLVRERVGRGQVVLFANDPVFRGYSLGTQRLFANAAILGAGFKSL
jgi:hypothetical protein